MSTEKRTSKSEQTLQRILNAALSCYQQKGIAHTTLEEVASEAGVGKSTVYRYVSNRDDLLDKVLQHDAREVQQELEVITRHNDDLATVIVDTFIHNIRGRKARPINKLLFGEERQLLIDRITLDPERFLPMATNQLKKRFELAQSQGRVRDGVTLDMAAELITRLMVSYINHLGETGDDEQKLRQLLENMLVPAIINTDSKP